MERLTRDILERIAREFGLKPEDPKVLQIAYKMVWELATGAPAAAAPRDPHPLLPPDQNPAVRPPDQDDLSELVNAILEDPHPRTGYLAHPLPVPVNAATTGVWLRDLLQDVHRSADGPDQVRVEGWREYVSEPKDADLAALVADVPKPAPAPPAPAPHRETPAATIPARIRPRFAPRSGVQPSHRPHGDDTEALTPEQAAKTAPAWLISVAVHLLIAVVLMNIVYFSTRPRRGDVFRLSFHREVPEAAVKQPPPEVPDDPKPDGDKGVGGQEKGEFGNQNDDSLPPGKVDPDDPNPTGQSTGVEIPDKGLDGWPLGLGPSTALPGTGTSGKNGLGGLYEGRGGAGRGRGLAQYGGGEDTERAVELGLKWLADHQSRDGSWGAEDGGQVCGPVESHCGEMPGQTATAVTALALLAFLGHGHTHTGGPQDPYTATVEKAKDFLLSRQDRHGRFLESAYDQNYSHGIVTFALAEMYAMTQDPKLRAPVQDGLAHLIAVQQESGGWDYVTQRTIRGDVSVTGWQVMALRSARAAGLAVPKRVWSAAQQFLRGASSASRVTIAYEVTPRGPDGGTMGTLASGTLSRILLGDRDSDFEKSAANKVLAVPPAFGHGLENPSLPWANTLYYIYYGTLLQFNMGGDWWPRWNKAMKKALIGSQRREGHLTGSWDALGYDAMYAGRCYTTAMAVMCLEVYYRYLPAYKVDPRKFAALADGGGGSEEPEAKPAPKQSSTLELIAALKGAGMMERWNAARELARRKADSALAEVIAAARAEKTSARALMVESLGSYGPNEAALDALAAFLDEPEPRVREAAIRALQKATGNDLRTADEWRAWCASRSKSEDRPLK